MIRAEYPQDIDHEFSMLYENVIITWKGLHNTANGLIYSSGNMADVLPEPLNHYTHALKQFSEIWAHDNPGFETEVDTCFMLENIQTNALNSFREKHGIRRQATIAHNRANSQGTMHAYYTSLVAHAGDNASTAISTHFGRTAGMQLAEIITDIRKTNNTTRKESMRSVGAFATGLFIGFAAHKLHRKKI